MFCDTDGKVAFCSKCGQLHSPYWSAAKSAACHKRGIASMEPGHNIVVGHASKFLP